RESDLGVYMCRVVSRNETQQITVDVAEEVSAIFKDQSFFTVSQSITVIQTISLRITRLERQYIDCKGEMDNKLSSQYIKSDLSHQDEQPGDDRMGTKSKENFQLVVPSTTKEPEVSLGADFIIPCHLSPEISAVDMEISWSNDTACVCLYKDRKVTEGVLFKDRDKRTREPTHKLPRHTSHQSESDEKQRGNYSKSVSDDFQLVIPQTAQEAQISIGSEIIVPCHLTPEICAIAVQIKWFKETDCVCIFKKGHVIEGRSYKDRASLDTHELERGNVSLHLSNFSVSDVGDYYCQVISGDRTQQITVGGEYSAGPYFISSAC
ncbi:hypothetical protein cypCar_00045588, partial [Cyprinus carpio]